MEKPLKIGVITAFPPGKNSLNEFGWHMVQSFATKEEVEKLVVFADITGAGAPVEVENATMEPCWRFNSKSTIYQIARRVRKAKLDAVIFNLQFASFGDTRLAGGLGLLTPAVTKYMGTPTAVILHNLVENVDMEDAGFAENKLIAKAMSFAGRLLTKALLKADYVALTIPKYVELLEQSYGAKNVLLAPHGSFEQLAEPSFEVPEGPRKLLAFGKWGTYKTVDILIEAYRDLLARGYDNVEVVVAGTDSPNSPGYLAGIADSCQDLPGVSFPGYVEEQDVEPLFSSAAITVFPYSSTTGSSGVLHQAGSYGRCAVLPAIGDFVEVIEEEGFVGEYFTPNDASSLADALAKMLDDTARCEEMGRQNYAAAQGVPFTEVMDWHLIHMQELTKRKQSKAALERSVL